MKNRLAKAPELSTAQVPLLTEEKQGLLRKAVDWVGRGKLMLTTGAAFIAGGTSYILYGQAQLNILSSFASVGLLEVGDFAVLAGLVMYVVGRAEKYEILKYPERSAKVAKLARQLSPEESEALFRAAEQRCGMPVYAVLNKVLTTKQENNGFRILTPKQTSDLFRLAQENPTEAMLWALRKALGEDAHKDAHKIVIVHKWYDDFSGPNSVRM